MNTLRGRMLILSAVVLAASACPAVAQNSYPATGTVQIFDRGDGCCAALYLIDSDQQTHLYTYGNGYGSGAFQIHKYGSGSANGAVFTISKTGNVVIGTASPGASYKLD